MDAIEVAEITLRQAVDHMPQGLAVFDPDLRLVVSNRRYRELLDLPERLVVAGTALYDIALYVGRRGRPRAGRRRPARRGTRRNAHERRADR